MKITKVKLDTSKNLILDENDELKEVDILEYHIAFQNEEEYKSIRDVIFTADIQGIEVYQCISKFDRVIVNSTKLLVNNDVYLILTTNDKTKFDELKTIITNIAKTHSDTLH